jgi:hypothetical protein
MSRGRRETAALAHSRHGADLAAAGNHSAALPLLQEAEALTLPAVSPTRSFNLGVTQVALGKGEEAQKVRAALSCACTRARSVVCCASFVWHVSVGVLCPALVSFAVSNGMRSLCVAQLLWRWFPYTPTLVYLLDSW